MTGSPTELGALASEVRSLAAAGCYAEAQRSFEVYCQVLAGTFASLPPGDPRARQLEREWRGLLEETRRQVLAGRAHAATRLARLPHPGRFGGDLQRYTWEILG